MENFEQLKRNMMWAFENRPEIPQEIFQLIQKMFLQLEEKYNSMKCNNSSIREYMQGNLDELIAKLEGKVGNSRKDEQFNDIKFVLERVRQNIEEKLDDEEQMRKDNQTQSQINEIGNNGNNIRISINTIYLIEESLRDVQSRQNKILHARGTLKDKQIEDINDEVIHFIAQLRNKNENEIHTAYKKDCIELRKELLEIYQEYIMQREHGKEDQKQNISSSFKKSLSVEISLEEQKAFSEDVLEELLNYDENELESNSLPSDLLK